MQVQPYLSFDGRTEEAIKFYQKTLKAEIVMMLRFKESPDTSMVTPENAEKIMHSTIRVGDTTFMASDGHCTGKTSFQGFNMNIMADSEGDAERIFAALGDGGQVQMPMTPTFFADRFGMVVDRFGVSWMVMKPKPMA
ncbi:MAG TPA: VOC family protein [Dongiaceae bacterium]